jgi:hypothetical protein
MAKNKHRQNGKPRRREIKTANADDAQWQEQLVKLVEKHTAGHIVQLAKMAVDPARHETQRTKAWTALVRWAADAGEKGKVQRKVVRTVLAKLAADPSDEKLRMMAWTVLAATPDETTIFVEERV